MNIRKSTMTCQELLASLGDYVDGELDPAISGVLSEHIKDCPPCEVVVDNIRHTMTLYKSGRAVELPAALQAKLDDLLRLHWRRRFPAAETGDNVRE